MKKLNDDYEDTIETLFKNHRGEIVRKSLREMEKDFCRRILPIVFLCLRDHLPQELIVMIGRRIPRDYAKIPFEFSVFRPTRANNYGRGTLYKLN